MIFLYDVLSIWELTHRWCNLDPNLSDPEKLPLEIQDKLRFLTRYMARHELHTCSFNGIENTIELDIMHFEEFIDLFYSNENLSEGEQWSNYEDYQANMHKKLEAHNSNIEDLEKCFQQRIYDKEKLDSIFVLQHKFAQFCKREEIELPKFWYPDNWDIDAGGVIETKNTTNQRLKVNQEDRISCRAIAQTLWDTNPELTIEGITKHPHILIYGNGKQYKGRDTIRNWIKDLDPRSTNDKVGRPSKKNNKPTK
ncbi:MAG: hypothetical protein QM500_15760 [Methylococcales bacterium]